MILGTNYKLQTLLKINNDPWETNVLNDLKKSQMSSIITNLINAHLNSKAVRKYILNHLVTNRI